MYRRLMGWGWGLLLACTACALVSACGGGGSSSSLGTGPNKSGREVSALQSSKEFVEPNKKISTANSIARFGKEASLEEREEANIVILKSYDARARGDFETQCETLDRAMVKELVNAKFGGKKHHTCPETLHKFAEPLSKSKVFRKNNISGSIAALRVKGPKAYALYHGTDGSNYALGLVKEDAKWLLIAIVPYKLGV
ncbi:MAG: hypothetical protein JST08_21880 [Actinobacteria bacterium]|nr:hypothetical protein [Actinomycetota bacterium]